MKDNNCYKIQLVGNLDTVKRMVASLFLVDAKKEKQTLKVRCLSCIDAKSIKNLGRTKLSVFCFSLIENKRKCICQAFTKYLCVVKVKKKIESKIAFNPHDLLLSTAYMHRSAII